MAGGGDMSIDGGRDLSLLEFADRFPDEETATAELERLRWPQGVKCPYCGSDRVGKLKTRNLFQCYGCDKQFNVRTDTPMYRSRIPLRKWLIAMYVVMMSRKGISSIELSKVLGIRQTSAWFLLHRLREMMGKQDVKLEGMVEVDETYLGGLAKFMHANKKKGVKPGSAHKQILLGLRQRDGPILTTVIPSTKSDELLRRINAMVQPGTQLFTDDLRSYNLAAFYYPRVVLNHAKGHYTEGIAHTNGIESVWAVLKRSYRGTFHHWSPRHSQRYADEVAFRLCEGHVELPMAERLGSLVRNGVGRRLTYKWLTRKQLRL